MRYAFVSDIHGNLPAWNTVLSDIALRDVDRIVCLGDVVGYGPEPAEVLRSVYEHVHLMVLGNHDAVVAGRLASETFNDRAQRMIVWTADQLGPRAQEFFRDLPLVIKGATFRCVHGDFTDPAVFNYIETPEEALASFNAVSEPVLFCGHSHQAGLFVIGTSGIPHQLAEQDFSVESGKRYIVNVGSVGYSRGGDPRASYVIYDEDGGAVRFFRVSYDFEAFRAAAARKHLGPDEIPLLRRAPTGALDSVRDVLDFSPDATVRVTGAIVENDVTMLLKKRTQVWKIATIAAVAAAFVAIGVATAIVLKSGPKPSAFPLERSEPLALAAYAGADGNVFPSLVAQSVGGFSAAPFRLVLSDARYLHVDALPIDDTRTAVRIFGSDSRSEAIFETPDITCVGGERLEVMAKVAFSEGFEGECVLRIKLLRGEAGGELSESVLVTRRFVNHVGLRDENLPVALRGLPNSEGWWLARGTTDPVPADARFVRAEVRGKFVGDVHIGGLSVRRK